MKIKGLPLIRVKPPELYGHFASPLDQDRLSTL